MSRTPAHLHPRRPIAVMLAAAMLLTYISGLPTLLHFSVEHSFSADAAACPDGTAPASPLDDHANDCGVWDFVAHGVTNVPPPPTVSPPSPTRELPPIVPQASDGVFALGACPGRGPPTI